MDYIKVRIKKQSVNDDGGVKTASIHRFSSSFMSGTASNDFLKVVHALSKTVFTHKGFPYTLDFVLE